METTGSVLITGGSAGIGLGLAVRYLAAGHRVIVTGRRADRLASVPPGLETLAGDISDPGDRERLAAEVARTMPELDVLINNAGLQRRVSIAADHDPWATALAGHGADPDEFCDTVFPLLDGTRPEVGFGPTASAAFTERAAAEREMFESLAPRFTATRF